MSCSELCATSTHTRSNVNGVRCFTLRTRARCGTNSSRLNQHRALLSRTRSANGEHDSLVLKPLPCSPSQPCDLLLRAVPRDSTEVVFSTITRPTSATPRRPSPEHRTSQGLTTSFTRATAQRWGRRSRGIARATFFITWREHRPSISNRAATSSSNPAPANILFS